MSPKDPPRVVKPNREQITLVATDLNSAVADDHPVRAIWALVLKLDLDAYYDEIGSRGSGAGRPATDPAVLLTLWLFATSEGVGSARQLEELCERDALYRWICGGVSVNHHTLSDFRVKHGPKLDALLTQVLAALMSQGVVTLKRVAQDGMRVRASAGKSSFRRQQTLERCRTEASEQVRTLRKELADDPAASTKRLTAERERAAQARLKAIEAALAQIPIIEEQRDEQEKKHRKRPSGEIRVSTTDPESRVMKMANGGFNPAYNVQLATDESGVIVGADVTNTGSDQPTAMPMLEDIERRTGKVPSEYLLDGGFVSEENLVALAQKGAVPYAPVPEPQKAAIDRFAPKPDDPAEVAQWRERMGTPEGKEVYGHRGRLAERTNADLKEHRGLTHFNVRGLVKVKSVVLLAALTFNVLRMLALT